MKPAIVVDGVSKKYSRRANAHLSYGLSDLWRELRGRQGTSTLRPDEFLAVNDVSFHLNPGDTFALVGRNGSGKTTLLKMMNGLIKPDKGTLILEGRIQGLINLGAGFDPRLSGRDNIYTSAALMGLTRSKTTDMIDAIVDFSELEEFIDSPVQTYSKGMYARLGFGVAIHLEPDILLIDEILSVGDAGFQNKCFTRMQELKNQGVTIVLVSHSHHSVIQLCERALWLHKGDAMQIGPSKEVVGAYLEFLDAEELKKVNASNRAKAVPASALKIVPGTSAGESLYGPIYNEVDRIDELAVRFVIDGVDGDSVSLHHPLTIEYEFNLKQKVSDLNVTLKFWREDGVNLTTISTLNGDLVKHIRSGLVRCAVTIPDLNFNPGRYVLVIAIHEGKSYLYRDVVKKFIVTGRGQMTWGLTDFKYEYKVGEESIQLEVRTPNDSSPEGAQA